jgi:tetratricopeptide (TPR) repeat protein
MILATAISRVFGDRLELPRGNQGRAASEEGPRSWIMALVLCGLLARACCVSAQEESVAALAARNLHEAQEHYRKEPLSIEAAWQFARACFDVADAATNKAQRAEAANQGIAASKQALARESNSAPLIYYYGMNLAQLAQTKLLGALKIVHQMEREFLLVRALDEHFDYAGADRNLGLLYRDAPSLGSIGDRAKAREHLLRAVELAPLYPENRLNLIETYSKWHERDAASRQLKALEELWPEARASLTGAAWAASWADWDQRLKQVKNKIGEPSKPLEAPRQK